ncbi:uncharacterized protein [Aristolochia californica]|uniref:uncharacterized protein n=1 Tax=Aristolochia californica TaxID=171875 RepID=UPI0035DAF09F
MKSLMESSIPTLSTAATTIASGMLSSSSSSSSWIIDSWASEHLLGNKHLFCHYLRVFLINSLLLLMVPKPRSLEKDLTTKQVISSGHKKGGLYYFTLPPLAALSSTTFEAQHWHNWLGHPSTSSLRSLLPSLKVLSNFSCEAYCLRKERRSCITSHPISNFMSHHRLSSECFQFISSLYSTSIPQSFQEALKHPRWKATMDEEMHALYENQTWSFCYVIDYEEIFFPVAKLNSGVL